MRFDQQCIVDRLLIRCIKVTMSIHKTIDMLVDFIHSIWARATESIRRDTIFVPGIC